MKKQQVKIGGVYSAKITDKVVPVRIDAENRNGGWDATNLKTNRKVRIKSAQKLRGSADVPDADGGAKGGGKTRGGSATRAKKAAKGSTATKPRARRDTGQRRAKGAKRDGSKAKPLSLLNAAAQVLADSTEPLNTREMVAQATERGLWTPRAGKTPASTLYASILREMNTKGDEARFTKVERGRFTLSAAGKKGA